MCLWCLLDWFFVACGDGQAAVTGDPFYQVASSFCWAVFSCLGSCGLDRALLCIPSALSAIFVMEAAGESLLSPTPRALDAILGMEAAQDLLGVP